MAIALSLNKILDRIDYSNFEGELGVRNITGVASLDDAKVGDATFVSSSKFADKLANCQASLVILGETVEATPKNGQLFLRVDKPSIEMAKLCEQIEQLMWVKPEPGVHRQAVIDEGATVHPLASVGPFVQIAAGASIGASCIIEAGCRIGQGCKVGEGSRLSANVVLERDTILGKRVRLHAGVVLGSDGFGYEFEEGRHRKVPQVGSVEIGDDVEIGANSTIDRGRFGPTRIGTGTKIDNLVQIGHNVVVGQHCILCSQVGLAGTTELGDYVVMGGRAGASGHLKIGNGAQLAGECVAYADLEGGNKYGGSPAVSLVAYQRMLVLQRRLPDLFKRMKHLESQLVDD